MLAPGSADASAASALRDEAASYRDVVDKVWSKSCIHNTMLLLKKLLVPDNGVARADARFLASLRAAPSNVTVVTRRLWGMMGHGDLPFEFEHFKITKKADGNFLGISGKRTPWSIPATSGLQEGTAWWPVGWVPGRQDSGNVNRFTTPSAAIYVPTIPERCLGLADLVAGIAGPGAEAAAAEGGSDTKLSQYRKDQLMALILGGNKGFGGGPGASQQVQMQAMLTEKDEDAFTDAMEFTVCNASQLPVPVFPPNTPDLWLPEYAFSGNPMVGWPAQDHQWVTRGDARAVVSALAERDPECNAEAGCDGCAHFGLFALTKSSSSLISLRAEARVVRYEGRDGGAQRWCADGGLAHALGVHPNAVVGMAVIVLVITVALPAGLFFATDSWENQDARVVGLLAAYAEACAKRDRSTAAGGEEYEVNINLAHLMGTRRFTTREHTAPVWTVAVDQGKGRPGVWFDAMCKPIHPAARVADGTYGWPNHRGFVDTGLGEMYNGIEHLLGRIRMEAVHRWRELRCMSLTHTSAATLPDGCQEGSLATILAEKVQVLGLPPAEPDISAGLCSGAGLDEYRGRPTRLLALTFPQLKRFVAGMKEDGGVDFLDRRDQNTRYGGSRRRRQGRRRTRRRPRRRRYTRRGRRRRQKRPRKRKKSRRHHQQRRRRRRRRTVRRN